MKKNIAALCTGLEEMEIGEVAMPEVGDENYLIFIHTYSDMNSQVLLLKLEKM